MQSGAGAAGSVESFRAYLDALGIADAGPGGTPTAAQGVSWLDAVELAQALPSVRGALDIAVDALQVLRRDEGSVTQLWVTVALCSTRGAGEVARARTFQEIYTVEPGDFSGLD